MDLEFQDVRAEVKGTMVRNILKLLTCLSRAPWNPYCPDAKRCRCATGRVLCVFLQKPEPHSPRVQLPFPLVLTSAVQGCKILENVLGSDCLHSMTLGY